MPALYFDHKWQSYRQKVIPPNAGPTQLTETRRAFYAGAFAAVDRVCEHVLSRNTQLSVEDLLRKLIQEIDETVSQEGLLPGGGIR